MNRKRVQSPASPGIQLGLIITPMLDMSFQILAFFIMTYHPSALEANIPGSLLPSNPAINNQDKLPAVNDVPPLAAVELPEDVVTVKVTNDAGAPRQIFVQIPPAVDAELIADVDVDFSIAVRRLEARLRKLDAKSAQIKIDADGALRQQYVVAAYDAARRAGFSKIHFVAPRMLNAKAK